jgi:preprotein translocase subunit SecA
MFSKLAKIATSRRNNKSLKKYNANLTLINNAGKSLESKTDQELKQRIEELRSGSERGNNLLVESFAICREASNRILKMRHFDVQIICGLVLNDNKVAEMKTGEGKTLSAVLPVFYRSLINEQVHLVTANEYLATRDREDLLELFEFLGIKSGAIHSQMNGPEKKAIYNDSDVIYGTSSEFAFDYLRDNTSTDNDHLFQKGHIFAIVDEIDSILIDESRNPLIISGEGESDNDMVLFLNKIAKDFTLKFFTEKTDEEKHDVEEDIVLYEKNKDASLTDNGFEKLELLLVEHKVLPYAGSLYETKNLYIVERFLASVKGLFLYNANIDYVVRDKSVMIINQQTGRIEAGRRWGDGLHQTIEAKEGVEIKPESRSIANTTLPNYFRLYSGLCGMTGTAQTDAEEFLSVYGLEVVCINTNRPMVRKDEIDQVYLTKKVKMEALINNIKSAYFLGRPVLVGTSSVEESEEVSLLLKSQGLSHNMLNAKNHFMEAEIIAQAGMPSVITISTNMAGRGTDIILGGSLKSWIKGLDSENEDDIFALKEHWKTLNEKVIASGGLHVVGTSRNSSRRVDNQLMGRSGRQGDPGSSVFFVSMEDKLLKLFGTDKYADTLRSIGVEENDCISSSLANKGIAKSQLKLEEQHFKMRKELFKYDDIVNIQRMHTYDMRSEWLHKDFGNIADINKKLAKDVVDELFSQYMPSEAFEETWDTEGLEKYFNENWALELNIKDKMIGSEVNQEVVLNETLEAIYIALEKYLESIPTEIYFDMSRKLMVKTIDQYWYEEMHALEQLKQGIHLRGYAQKDPIMEFKKESLTFFSEMMTGIKEQYIASIMTSLKSTVEANSDEAA